MRLIIEDGLAENEVGSVTQQRLLGVFEEVLRIQEGKARTYGDAWRSQGEMGNVARVLSKVSRIKQMVWRAHPIEDAEETVRDTLIDLICLAAFAIINREDHNRWGNQDVIS